MFKYLLLILLFYLVLRFIKRLVFGAMSVGRSARQGFNDQDTERRREGEVYIKYKPKVEDKRITKDDGEYVKFEEIDDE